MSYISSTMRNVYNRLKSNATTDKSQCNITNKKRILKSNSRLVKLLPLVLLSLLINEGHGSVGTALRGGTLRTPPMDHKVVSFWFGDNPMANSKQTKLLFKVPPSRDMVNYPPVASFQSKVTQNANKGTNLYPYLRTNDASVLNLNQFSGAQTDGNYEYRDINPGIDMGFENGDIEKISTKSLGDIPNYFEEIASTRFLNPMNNNIEYEEDPRASVAASTSGTVKKRQNNVQNSNVFWRFIRRPKRPLSTLLRRNIELEMPKTISNAPLLSGRKTGVILLILQPFCVSKSVS